MCVQGYECVHLIMQLQDCKKYQHQHQRLETEDDIFTLLDLSNSVQNPNIFSLHYYKTEKIWNYLYFDADSSRCLAFLLEAKRNSSSLNLSKSAYFVKQVVMIHSFLTSGFFGFLFCAAFVPVAEFPSLF